MSISNGIDHVTTALFHPQSNGQAERFVDTIKLATKKLEEGGGSTVEALVTFLLAYRLPASTRRPITIGDNVRTSNSHLPRTATSAS